MYTVHVYVCCIRYNDLVTILNAPRTYTFYMNSSYKLFAFFAPALHCAIQDLSILPAATL